MRTVDISKIKKVYIDYRNLSEDLTLNHKGQWNDPVHDSFAIYNSQVKASSEIVSHIYDSTKDIVDTSFNNNDLISRADRILSEVNSL